MIFKKLAMLLSVRIVTVLLFAFALTQIQAQEYMKIYKGAIVVDTHNDFLSSAVEKHYAFDDDLRNKMNIEGLSVQTDLQRILRSGIDVQVFSVFCDESFGKGTAFTRANTEIDTLYAIVNRHPDKMMIVTNSEQLKQAIKQRKLAAMMGVEGGHMIEDNLDYLDSLYKRGARYMTLTWNNSTSWATSASDESRDSSLQQPKGLNDFGRQVVKRMNELGMMVDLSHVGEKTFWDAINTTTKPVLVSHSDAYALNPVPRNLKDDQIKAVAKNGGVIDVNFFSGFVDSNYNKRNKAFLAKHKAERDSLLALNMNIDEANGHLYSKYKSEAEAMRPPLSLLIDHIDYIVKLAGVDHVGLGSDFDGIPSSTQQLNDVTDMPLIAKELVKRGYSEKDIQKILGGNFIRVFKANMKQ